MNSISNYLCTEILNVCETQNHLLSQLMCKVFPIGALSGVLFLWCVNTDATLNSFCQIQPFLFNHWFKSSLISALWGYYMLWCITSLIYFFSFAVTEYSFRCVSSTQIYSYCRLTAAGLLQCCISLSYIVYWCSSLHDSCTLVNCLLIHRLLYCIHSSFFIFTWMRRCNIFTAKGSPQSAFRPIVSFMWDKQPHLRSVF